MAEGQHISKAELEEMERRKRMSAEIGVDHNDNATAGEREQQAELDRTETRERIFDPSLTMNPD